jgi:hypothetical protein
MQSTGLPPAASQNSSISHTCGEPTTLPTADTAALLYYSAACSALNWEPDEEGINGMVITKTLPSEAANVLEKGVRKITPSIMTWGQYAEAAVNYIQQASITQQLLELLPTTQQALCMGAKASTAGNTAAEPVPASCHT